MYFPIDALAGTRVLSFRLFHVPVRIIRLELSIITFNLFWVRTLGVILLGLLAFLLRLESVLFGLLLSQFSIGLFRSYRGFLIRLLVRFWFLLA